MLQRPKQISEGVLFTDQYQLSMAQLYFRMGLHERPAQFEHTFRKAPDYGLHQAGYAIAAGLEWLIDWMRDARFHEDEVAVLRAQRNRAGKPVFAEDFLDYLATRADFGALEVFALPEGRVAHAHVPLTLVRGPLLMAQLLETALLNQINYQTLVATKASRLREVSRAGMVLEFGLRRGQGFGANAGTRAALIGGADYTSNVGMAHAVGQTARGTHAHAMVQAFIALGMSELDAFRAYSEVYPDDCLLLVDTVNTLESGVPHAITVFEELRARGHEPVGIRLDSGDLAYLSIQAALMLDRAGFPRTSIVLSNDLDELVIWQIQSQIAAEAPRYGADADAVIRRLIYGVGTRLITSHGDAALGGVYKLVAVHEAGAWKPAIKLADQVAKMTNPGLKQAWRIYDRRGYATADLLALEDERPDEAEELVLQHPTDQLKQRVIRRDEVSAIEPLLEKVWADGARIGAAPTLEEMRERRRLDVERLDAGVRRIVNPHIYHVSLSETLWQLKRQLVHELRERR